MTPPCSWDKSFRQRTSDELKEILCQNGREGTYSVEELIRCLVKNADSSTLLHKHIGSSSLKIGRFCQFPKIYKKQIPVFFRTHCTIWNEDMNARLASDCDREDSLLFLITEKGESENKIVATGLVSSTPTHHWINQFLVRKEVYRRKGIGTFLLCVMDEFITRLQGVWDSLTVNLDGLPGSVRTFFLSRYFEPTLENPQILGSTSSIRYLSGYWIDDKVVARKGMDYVEEVLKTAFVVFLDDIPEDVDNACRNTYDSLFAGVDAIILDRFKKSPEVLDHGFSEKVPLEDSSLKEVINAGKDGKGARIGRINNPKTVVHGNDQITLRIFREKLALLDNFSGPSEGDRDCLFLSLSVACYGTTSFSYRLRMCLSFLTMCLSKFPKGHPLSYNDENDRKFESLEKQMNFVFYLDEFWERIEEYFGQKTKKWSKEMIENLQYVPDCLCNKKTPTYKDLQKKYMKAAGKKFNLYLCKVMSKCFLNLDFQGSINDVNVMKSFFRLPLFSVEANSRNVDLTKCLKGREWEFTVTPSNSLWPNDFVKEVEYKPILENVPIFLLRVDGEHFVLLQNELETKGTMTKGKKTQAQDLDCGKVPLLPQNPCESDEGNGRLEQRSNREDEIPAVPIMSEDAEVVPQPIQTKRNRKNDNYIDEAAVISDESPAAEPILAIVNDAGPVSPLQDSDQTADNVNESTTEEPNPKADNVAEARRIHDTDVLKECPTEAVSEGVDAVEEPNPEADNVAEARSIHDTDVSKESPTEAVSAAVNAVVALPHHVGDSNKIRDTNNSEDISNESDATNGNEIDDPKCSEKKADRDAPESPTQSLLPDVSEVPPVSTAVFVSPSTVANQSSSGPELDYVDRFLRTIQSQTRSLLPGAMIEDHSGHLDASDCSSKTMSIAESDDSSRTLSIAEFDDSKKKSSKKLQVTFEPLQKTRSPLHLKRQYLMDRLLYKRCLSNQKYFLEDSESLRKRRRTQSPAKRKIIYDSDSDNESIVKKSMRSGSTESLSDPPKEQTALLNKEFLFTSIVGENVDPPSEMTPASTDPAEKELIAELEAEERGEYLATMRQNLEGTVEGLPDFHCGLETHKASIEAHGYEYFHSQSAHSYPPKHDLRESGRFDHPDVLNGILSVKKKKLEIDKLTDEYKFLKKKKVPPRKFNLPLKDLGIYDETQTTNKVLGDKRIAGLYREELIYHEDHVIDCQEDLEPRGKTQKRFSAKFPYDRYVTWKHHKACVDVYKEQISLHRLFHPADSIYAVGKVPVNNECKEVKYKVLVRCPQNRLGEMVVDLRFMEFHFDEDFIADVNKHDELKGLFCLKKGEDAACQHYRKEGNIQRYLDNLEPLYDPSTKDTNDRIMWIRLVLRFSPYDDYVPGISDVDWSIACETECQSDYRYRSISYDELSKCVHDEVLKKIFSDKCFEHYERLTGQELPASYQIDPKDPEYMVGGTLRDDLEKDTYPYYWKCEDRYYCGTSNDQISAVGYDHDHHEFYGFIYFPDKEQKRVVLTEDWVDENLREFKGHLQLHSANNPQRRMTFLKVPPGDFVEIPDRLISKDGPMIHYRQNAMEKTCVFSSFCSVLHHLGFDVLAKALDNYRKILSVANDPIVEILKFIYSSTPDNKEFSHEFRKKHYKCKRIHDFFNVIEHPYGPGEFALVVLWAKDGSRTHCVGVLENWIFESNAPRAMPLSKESLDACCAGEYSSVYQGRYFHQNVKFSPSTMLLGENLVDFHRRQETESARQIKEYDDKMEKEHRRKLLENAERKKLVPAVSGFTPSRKKKRIRKKTIQ